MLPLRLRKSPPSSPGLDLQLRSAAGDGQDGGAPRQTDAPADSSASRRGPGRGRAARGPCCLKAQRSRALRSSAPRAPLLREEDRPANGKPPAARRLCPRGDARPPRKARPLPTAWWEVSVPTWTHKMGRRRGVGGHRKRGERASPRPLCVPGASRLVRGVPFCPIPLTLRPHLDEREHLPHWKMPDTCNCKMKWLLQHVSLVTRCLKSAWRDKVPGKNGERAAEPARRRRGLRVAGQRALGVFLI